MNARPLDFSNPVGIKAMSAQKPTSRNPWVWVPSLYIAEGIPYVMAMTVSVVLYKRLGISNTDIAFYTNDGVSG